MLAVARDYRHTHWLMIVVGYLHALRASEVVAIKKVDVRDGFLTVRRGKCSEMTTQPLLMSANPLLSERESLIEYAARGQGIQPLFNVCRGTFWNVLQRHGKTAGLPTHQCHPHILKQSCLTHMIAAVGLPATQKWAGHLVGSSTLIYTRMSQVEASRCAQMALCG